jgi:hypothetical protein
VHGTRDRVQPRAVAGTQAVSQLRGGPQRARGRAPRRAPGGALLRRLWSSGRESRRQAAFHLQGAPCLLRRTSEALKRSGALAVLVGHDTSSDRNAVARPNQEATRRRLAREKDQRGPLHARFEKPQALRLQRFALSPMKACTRALSRASMSAARPYTPLRNSGPLPPPLERWGAGPPLCTDAKRSTSIVR